MSILKGFGQIAMLINNDPNVIPPIGELSADSRTFVKEVTEYNHSDYPGVTYLGMQSLDDALEVIQPTSEQTNICLELITWVHSKARSGEIGPSPQGFETLFNTAFDGRFTLLQAGVHVLSGTYWYPVSISVAPVGRELEDNWTIWFSDSAINNEFDVSLMYVVPPIENIDQFFNQPAVVEALVKGMSRTTIMDKVTEIRGPSPYTVLRMDDFDWYFANNPDIKIETYWTVVIYGRAGNNLDKVKEAIIEHVLANSVHPIEDWAIIFPDIFRSTEMVITPNYFVQGVPDQQFERGVYSAIRSYKDTLALANVATKGHGYTPEHILDSMTGIPSLFRSVELNIVMGPENRPGYQHFRDIYGDYINVPTTQVQDFMRMSEQTREFVMLLTDMLEKAETLTPSTVIPAGFNRVHRDGIWYLAKSTNDLLILVTTKFSVSTLAIELAIPSDQV